MQKCRVAHVKLSGVDTILVPMVREFGARSGGAQADTYDQVRKLCDLARMRGELVLVWENKDGSVSYVADAKMHASLKRVTPSFLHTNLNRELSAAQMPAYLLPAGQPAPATPAVAPTSELISDTSASFRTPAQPAGNEEQPRPQPPPRRERNYPMRLLTMIFTDTVGSTALKQKLGDQPALELKRWHDSIIRGELALTATGEEISTAGDSFFITFDTPSEAVRFALQVQARLREGNGHGPALLKDRIGIHVGEVFYEHNGSPGKLHDVHGIQVDSTARLMSLADGDQILLTRFAFENAQQTFRGTRVEGLGPLTWNQYGEYSLKGVEQAVDVFEVGETGRAHLRPPADSSKAKRMLRTG